MTTHSTSIQRVLLPCHRVTTAGGFKRFERVARAWGDAGPSITVAVGDTNAQGGRVSRLPVLPLDEALEQSWDAVMIPGAGFPAEFFPRLKEFRDDRFGIRVQHVLNDQSKRGRFLKVNKAFKPHVMIFNNLAWPAGSFTEFQAERFHTLPGAVDVERFSSVRRKPDEGFVLGALLNKNPEPLLAALDHLPPDVRVHCFGRDKFKLRESHAALFESGRVVWSGVLEDDALPGFYAGVDCVVSTEEFAGWSNLCAEAMASGVPVICTPHGTQAFAEHDTTALLIDSPEPERIAAAAGRLRSEDGLARRLASAARERIGAYDWNDYARDLLGLLYRDGHPHYSCAPEFGLYGKWPTDVRLSDLDPLLDVAEGKSVIDFGGAEGIVTHAMLSRGAARARMFEIEPARVETGRRICAEFGRGEFRQADLSDWDAFASANGDWLNEPYDIVMYLGIHHHLPRDKRMRTIGECLKLAREYFALRTPEKDFVGDGLAEVIAAAGFEPIAGIDKQLGHAGIAKLYRRTG